MPTSIRDLIQTLEDEARHHAGSARHAADAVGALHHLGRALNRLAYDGLELHKSGAREEITLDLAESSAAAVVQRDSRDRLTTLAGGLADTVALVSEQSGRDQRWAITIELANTIRVVSTYAAEGDGRRLADLAWIHLTARSLVARGVRDAPTIQSEAVLDRAIPRMHIAADMPPAQAARESLAVISDRLHRAYAGQTRISTLLEVLAVCRAAETTTRYGSLISAALTGRSTSDALPAAAIWHEIRERLHQFAKTAPVPIGDRGLGPWALRAHTGLSDAFSGLTAAENGIRADRSLDTVAQLHAMVNEIPSIADYLGTTIRRLADTGHCTHSRRS